MITYFPHIYPDELFYSLLARYYIKSGYLAYIFAAEEFFDKSTSKPNIEFITPLSKDFLEFITDSLPLDTIIEKHTMFPFYVRFLELEKRKSAYKAILNMQKDYYKLLCVPKDKNGTIRYLRYCPLCVKEDRENYGETYWHRIHQIMGINICPKHCCYLENSNLLISSIGSPSLITAEETISENSTVMLCKNILEINIVNYINSVFNLALDFKSKVNIGDFLHTKMENTKYLSLRGKQRNMELLCNDFNDYYEDINFTLEQWQLQKIFNNNRHKPYEILLLAYFLNIPIEELEKLKLPKTAQYQNFDSRIIEMHNKGLNYAKIARTLGASYDVVKAIGEGRY